MLVRTIITINVPQLGGPIDQEVEFSDFREVDGVKIPFVTKSSNPVQTITATVLEVKAQHRGRRHLVLETGWPIARKRS